MVVDAYVFSKRTCMLLGVKRYMQYLMHFNEMLIIASTNAADACCYNYRRCRRRSHASRSLQR
jgi:hypothetical protein